MPGNILNYFTNLLNTSTSIPNHYPLFYTWPTYANLILPCFPFPFYPMFFCFHCWSIQYHVKPFCFVKYPQWPYQTHIFLCLYFYILSYVFLISRLNILSGYFTIFLSPCVSLNTHTYHLPFSSDNMPNHIPTYFPTYKPDQVLSTRGSMCNLSPVSPLGVPWRVTITWPILEWVLVYSHNWIIPVKYSNNILLPLDPEETYQYSCRYFRYHCPIWSAHVLPLKVPSSLKYAHCQYQYPKILLPNDTRP